MAVIKEGRGEEEEEVEEEEEEWGSWGVGGGKRRKVVGVGEQLGMGYGGVKAESWGDFDEPMRGMGEGGGNGGRKRRRRSGDYSSMLS